MKNRTMRRVSISLGHGPGDDHSEVDLGKSAEKTEQEILVLKASLIHYGFLSDEGVFLRECYILRPNGRIIMLKERETCVCKELEKNLREIADELPLLTFHASFEQAQEVFESSKKIRKFVPENNDDEELALASYYVHGQLLDVCRREPYETHSLTDAAQSFEAYSTPIMDEKENTTKGNTSAPHTAIIKDMSYRYDQDPMTRTDFFEE